MIAWDERAELYGIDSRIVFFDPAAARAEASVQRRALPFMDTSAVETLAVEGDRLNLRFGGIVAQADGLFAYKDGLISLEYKTRGGRQISRGSWRHEVRCKDMLQCAMAGYVAAQSYRKLVACILRYDNAALMLTPKPEVVEAVLALVPMATSYYAETRDVAVSKLAAFAENRVRDRFGDVPRESHAHGQKAHEELLRR
jgi:hypothetical protein